MLADRDTRPDVREIKEASREDDTERERRERQKRRRDGTLSPFKRLN